MKKVLITDQKSSKIQKKMKISLKIPTRESR